LRFFVAGVSAIALADRLLVLVADELDRLASGEEALIRANHEW
jgi:hypothetical protein